MALWKDGKRHSWLYLAALALNLSFVYNKKLHHLKSLEFTPNLIQQKYRAKANFNMTNKATCPKLIVIQKKVDRKAHIGNDRFRVLKKVLALYASR